MANFTLSSLRGGLNDHDPEFSLQPDQSVESINVEYYQSTLGERRRGSDAISLPAGITAEAMVSFLYRHLPTADEGAAELWALATTVGVSKSLQRKTTVWAAVTFSDTFTNTGVYPFQVAAQSAHGKLFLAYKSDQNRLHVWDGTVMRRAGLAPPTAAPTAADTGVGTFATTRYYRVRETVKSGVTTLRRSEPSPVLTKAPSGTGTGLIVTKPADMGESATHWELEASLDNANFYLIATTVVGTATVTDSVSAVTGYAAGGTISPDSGDYTVIPSGKLLAMDEDRLVIGGNNEDPALGSRITWTTVYGDPGAGNDERIPIASNNFLDLDGYDGGELTCMSGPIDGSIYVAKWGHFYKLTRTGQRASAYNAISLTRQRGALPGSFVEGTDQVGRPCLYFLDPKVGPGRIGPSGLIFAGRDITETWKRVNINATQVVSRGLFYPDSNQVRWCVAVDGSNTPNFEIVLQVNECVETADGLRRGWTTFTGPSTHALAMCLFATNIDSGIARNLTLKPFIGVAGVASDQVQMTDTGDDDNGTAYVATVTSRPFILAGLMNKFGITAGALLATANALATVRITLDRNFGLETKSVDVNLAPSAALEDPVIKQIDNLSLSELFALQVTFTDTASPVRWELHRLDLGPRAEEAAGVIS